MTTLFPALAFVAASCIWTDCTLVGGLGGQYEEVTTNDYQRWVGEIRLQADYGQFYTACTHVSGISTPEPDGGLNYCAAGFRATF